MAAPWNTSSPLNRSGDGGAHLSSLEDLDVPADGSPALRVLICCVYSVVCAAGLVGNLLVLVLMRARGREKRSSIDRLVVNLAVTDLQFALTLPFWAADTARDFSWPFGAAMCKVVLSVTVINMYASVFFLTAMSVTRYRSVASALGERPRGRRCPGRRCGGRWLIVGLWGSAAAASLPTAVFAEVKRVAGERLCLLVFPDGPSWLALYHLQKILVGFVLPTLTVTVCYLLLLRLVRLRSMSGQQVKRRSRVTRSVTVVVLTFFLCWMPNQAVTLWGVLVKFNLVSWDRMFYLVHTYVFPLTVCLAHTNSCLNPLLYCLVRREFRMKLKRLLRSITSSSSSSSSSRAHPCPLRPCSRIAREEPDYAQVAIPLNTVETVVTEQGDTEEQRR